MSSSGSGRDVYSFDVVHISLPQSTTVSSTLQGALKDGVGEAVVACDMPAPCEFPSQQLTFARRGSCGGMRKFDLAPYPVVGLVPSRWSWFHRDLSILSPHKTTTTYHCSTFTWTTPPLIPLPLIPLLLSPLLFFCLLQLHFLSCLFLPISLFF